MCHYISTHVDRHVFTAPSTPDIHDDVTDLFGVVILGALLNQVVDILPLCCFRPSSGLSSVNLVMKKKSNFFILF